jgi:hypothetical protein
MRPRIPEQAPPRRHESLFRRIRGTRAGRLGLRHRHRRPFSPSRLCRRFRCLPHAHNHPWPSRRGPAVHAPSHERPDAARRRPQGPQEDTGSIFDGKFGRHLQREFFCPRFFLHGHGTRHRQCNVFGGLALRIECDGRGFSEAPKSRRSRSGKGRAPECRTRSASSRLQREAGLRKDVDRVDLPFRTVRPDGGRGRPPHDM